MMAPMAAKATWLLSVAKAARVITVRYRLTATAAVPPFRIKKKGEHCLDKTKNCL